MYLVLLPRYSHVLLRNVDLLMQRDRVISNMIASPSLSNATQRTTLTEAVSLGGASAMCILSSHFTQFRRRRAGETPEQTACWPQECPSSSSSCYGTNAVIRRRHLHYICCIRSEFQRTVIMSCMPISLWLCPPSLVVHRAL